MQRPGICIVCSQFFPIIGGTERQIQQLAEKLQELNQSLFILTTRPKNTLKKEIINHITVYRYLPGGVGGGQVVSILRTVILLLKEVYFLIKKRNLYDIIHVQQAFYVTIGAIIVARLLNKKVIFKIGCGGKLGDLAIIQNERFASLKFKILQNADAYIAISNQIEEELIQYRFSKDKIIKIPNGVDLNLFNPVDKEQKAVLKKKLCLPSKDIVISVTRTDRQKRLDILLQAWNIVVRQEPNLHLVIIVSNSISECEKIKQMSLCPESSVTFKSCINNVGEYLNTGEMFVLSSCFEGLPNAILEAMACELPVIGTDIGGTKDIIENQKTGLLIEPNNVEKLAQTIILLYRNKELQLSLSKRAKMIIKEKFSLAKVTQDYIKLYQKLLS